MTKLKIATYLIACAIASTGAVSASAADKKAPAKASQQTMTPESKRDMAEMYTKMGECMKTDKSMEQCQKDIMKDCPVMKKSGHCPLMEGMKPMMGDHSGMKGMDHSGH